MINGISSGQKIYRYTVRAQMVGTYTIGPARVAINNQIINSNVITVVVEQHQVQNVTKLAAFLRIGTDKNYVVVGEKILFVMRFYAQPSIKLEGMAKPDLSAFSSEELEGPFSGKKEIKGKEFNYVEWRGNFFAKKPGSFVIPAVSAIFTGGDARRPSSAFGSMFNSFFNHNFNQKQIYSNALTITVDPLPKYDGTVHGVGRFKTIRAEVDHAGATQGEGIVYRLVIEGDADFESMQVPELQMPDELKYYDSKTFTRAKNPMKWIKKCLSILCKRYSQG